MQSTNAIKTNIGNHRFGPVQLVVIEAIKEAAGRPLRLADIRGGHSVTTISESVGRLKRLGVIRVTRRRSPDNRYVAASTYELLVDGPFPPRGVAAGGQTENPLPVTGKSEIAA